jgi:hypothetical protein
MTTSIHLYSQQPKPKGALPKKLGEQKLHMESIFFQFCDANEMGINHKMILLDLEIKNMKVIYKASF